MNSPTFAMRRTLGSLFAIRIAKLRKPYMMVEPPSDLVNNACMEAMTRHRLAELKTMYDWRVTK